MTNSRETSISSVIGTGNGGGVILEGVVKGKNGFGAELGPSDSVSEHRGAEESSAMQVDEWRPRVPMLAHRHRKNILPYFLPRYPGHELSK